MVQVIQLPVHLLVSIRGHLPKYLIRHHLLHRLNNLPRQPLLGILKKVSLRSWKQYLQQVHLPKSQKLQRGVAHAKHGPVGGYGYKPKYGYKPQYDYYQPQNDYYQPPQYGLVSNYGAPQYDYGLVSNYGTPQYGGDYSYGQSYGYYQDYQPQLSYGGYGSYYP